MFIRHNLVSPNGIGSRPCAGRRTASACAGKWTPGDALSEIAELPVPGTEVVEVGDRLIEHTPELNILACQTIACQAGLQFGSRYVVNPLEG